MLNVRSILKSLSGILRFLLLLSIITHVSGYKKSSKKVASQIRHQKSPISIMLDSEFSSTNYSFEQSVTFFKSYPNNRFTTSQIEFLYSNAQMYGIHILVLATKLEQEQCLTRNNLEGNYEKRLSRALAYGLVLKIWDPKRRKYVCPYLGFEQQIRLGCRLLGFSFRDYTPNAVVVNSETKERIACKNAATFALYTYTPIWGSYLNCGIPCEGNILFVPLFSKFRAQWMSLNPGYTF